MISVLIVVFVLSYLAYRRVFYHSSEKKKDTWNIPDTKEYSGAKPEIKRLIDELKTVPFEEVRIESFDGLKLFGRYYHYKDGAPVQIEFHGYKGTAFRDFCGGSKLAKNLGQNILLVDQRAHGRSDGNTICFGIKEKYDCLAWAEYVSERFKDSDIVLSGVSMGGATVIEASELKLPEKVKCIIADCPFSSAEEIIGSECRKTKLPPVLAMPFIKLGARIYGKLKLSGGAEEAVKNAKVPVLIMHGEKDSFVPCEMSRKIKAANPEMVTLETFADAAHGMSYMVEPKRYERLTKEFFEKCGV